MPSRDITVSSNFISLPSNLVYISEKIQGATSKVEVNSYFPSKDKLKGVVWLFQGSGGFGKYWILRTEESEMMDLLVANDYAVITVDNEEVTQVKDLNKDGSLSFDYSADTLSNLDLINIKLIKNYFIALGKFNPSTPQIAMGFSSGGGFAEVVAAVYNWSASLSHNTGVVDYTADKSKVPHYQNNSYHDDGPNVGSEGNAKAIANMKKYNDRGIKNQMILQLPQPLHAERFARIDSVSVSQSTTAFNYLKQIGLLDNSNYLIKDPSPIQMDYEAHPDKYPALKAFSVSFVNEVFIQLKAVYTDHLFRSDYNGSALKFINEVLKITTPVKDEAKNLRTIFYPNPANDYIQFEKPLQYMIFNSGGTLLKSGFEKSANVSDLPSGVYFLKTKMNTEKVVISRH